MSCCRCTIPFGLPVEPEEYIQNAMSSRCVSAGARAADLVSHAAAARGWTGPGGVASPFVTTTTWSLVLRQASAGEGSTDAKSQIADVAPQSARYNFRR